MLCRKFELIPIIVGFFMNFLSCSKIWPNTLHYSTGSLAKFHQKWQGENSPFLLHFLIHINVLMLYRKFELISIKIGFLQTFKVAQNLGQRRCTISSKMKRREFAILKIFSDAYTCTYVV